MGNVIILQKKTRNKIETYFINSKEKSIEYREHLFITYKGDYKQWFNCFLNFKDNNVNNIVKGYQAQGYAIVD